MTDLTGAVIVNTRASHQAGALDELLKARGATSLAFPCIAITAPVDPAPLRAALALVRSNQFEWIVFTSVNAVHAVSLMSTELIISPLTRVAAVGEQTAACLRASFGIESILLPEEHRAAGIVTSLPIKSGERVLLPASSIARSELMSELQSKGAIVTHVTAYQTSVGTGGVDLPPLLANGSIDAIGFASPSAVDGFVDRVVSLGVPAAGFVSITSACIGHTTAERARTQGFQTVVTSSRQTMVGLVDALEAAVAPARRGVARCL